MYKSGGWMRTPIHSTPHFNGENADNKLPSDPSLNYMDLNRSYLDNRDHINIVDHYYYPDSDLETIQEESSVLDSEDDRSVHRETRRSSDSTVTSSRFSFDLDAKIRNSESDHSYSSLSSSSTPRRVSDKSPSDKEKSTSSSEEPETKVRSALNGFHNSSSYISYNGLDESEKITSPVDPLSQQKIVYAKCLTPKLDSQSTPPDHSLLKHNEQDHDDITITDMFEAARTGNIAALESFPAGELCDTVDEKGNTTLHMAAQHGHLPCVKKLVSMFTSQMITLPNDDLLTPTAMAIKNGHFPCVEWLLRHTPAREELTISQKTSSIDGANTRPPVAHVAARFNRSEMLDWICEEMSRDSIAIDAADHCSNTPVHVAARYGHLPCIQTLVSRGASVTVLNSDGDTPGQAAQKHGHDTTVGYLVVVETCVSLAQQLVALRNDMDGLKTENEKLRNDLVAKVASRSKSELVAMTSSKLGDVTSKMNGESKTEDASNESPAENEIKQQKRRILQEQPPPPKLWAPTTHQTAPKTKEKVRASIKGHAAVLNPTKKQQQAQNDFILQQRINAALNGPGISIDDVDGGTKEHPVENKEGKKTMKSSSSMKEETAADLNAEVELLTKDINIQKQRKPWEKLTMDEMLKMVRDIRYQPSPSISMCTEDSTMEPVEVMRERMAAASHWFLVERGREKPKYPQMPNKMPDNSRLDRRSQNIPHRNVSNFKNEPIRATAKITEMKKPSNSANLQSAIQQHYDSNTTPHHRHLQSHQDVTSFEAKTVTPPRGENKTPPTGTLKFMVSNSKSSPQTSIPGKTTKVSRDHKFSPINHSPNNSISCTPDTSPTTPISSSTQRNNSYRRAIQVPKNSNDITLSSDSQSSGSPVSVNTTRGPPSDHSSSKTSKSVRSAHEQKVWSQPGNIVRPKTNRDPLQKRTAKDTIFFPTFPMPQSAKSSSIHTLEAKSYSNEKVSKSNQNSDKSTVSNKSRPINRQPPRYFNNWTVPSNPKHLGAYKETGLGGRYNDDEDAEVAELSEVPEMKTEITSGQNRFLRKVQGRLK